MVRSMMLAGVALAALQASNAAAAPADAATAVPPAALSSDQPAAIDQSKDIIVSAPIVHSEADVLSGTSVVSGQELTRSLQPTIGETLAHQPGVSATSFGPNASRPILRGFQGDRIRVLTDGIGSIDVSNTSVDHAVIIDPLLAERIEVLRGPAALLYGSSAVGGVVNVIDKRIPRSVPSAGYRLDGIATYGSAANERTIGAASDVKLSDQIVLHADGSYLKTDNLRIGGFALTPERRAEALATSRLPQTPAPGEDMIDFAGNAAIRGILPNSASETWTAGVGAALITDGGSLGVSYSHYDSLYGVPIRYATLPGQGQESPRIDIVQNRLDIRAAVDTGGDVFKEIRFRAGAANYRQFELQPNGAIATTFLNKGFEGRLELVQARRGPWLGASGVQFSNREFNVIGDEAFLPRNATAQTGIFTQQQLDFGKVKIEAGIRYEVTDVDSRALPGDARFFNGARHFEALSGALGGSYALSDSVRIGVNLSHTERAPSAEELFANGGHAGTQAYELGNPNFRIEKSDGIEATLHVHGDGYSLDGSAYYNTFANYISDNQAPQSVCEAAAAASGRTVDLPCFQSAQADARYYGFELDGSVKLAQWGAYAVNVDALGDYVHATIVGQGPVPRIPAGRVLGGIEAQSDLLSGRIEAEHVFAQNRVAAFETPTRDYTLVNASLSLSPFASKKTTLTLSANNLFDVDARRAASFLKDFAPLAGRDIRLTARFSL
ncbi:MAG: TonB-dependent receptor [Sphingomonas sp. 28-62-20]|uniref:TonB-dependent receptor n=1 Tax=Sphingomonas sp. 28-62-20 TaxID=1970433 RepID=UPI000BD24430|nr:MAG: TonB-dependent receptor [Sphingomonas sp. 28-62-20]